MIKNAVRRTYLLYQSRTYYSVLFLLLINHIIELKFVIYDYILKTIVILDKMIDIDYLKMFIHTTFSEQPFSQYFNLKALNGRHLKYGNLFLVIS